MSRSRIAAVSLATAALAVLSVLSACGASGSESAPPPSGQAPSGALTVARAGSLGDVVTGSGGRTLYLFTKDTAKPSKSTCDGQCAAKWPPVPASGDTPAARGIDASLVGTVTRTDGTKQLTLNGWPLYEFAADKAPGDTKGQNVGGTWFAVTPQGTKATEAAQAPAQSGYGY